MNYFKSNQKGFTLIELLIVVAIVGILAGIGMTQYSDYKSMARDTNRLTMARNVMTALEGFYGDNLEYPSNPRGDQACSPVPENAFYHEDCLAGIQHFLSKESLEKNMRWSTYKDREEAIAYYNYSGTVGAVVKIQLEKMNRQNPCSFTSGNWCDESFPTMETAHCFCTGST